MLKVARPCCCAEAVSPSLSCGANAQSESFRTLCSGLGSCPGLVELNMCGWSVGRECIVACRRFLATLAHLKSYVSVSPAEECCRKLCHS